MEKRGFTQFPWGRGSGNAWVKSGREEGKDVMHQNIKRKNRAKSRRNLSSRNKTRSNWDIQARKEIIEGEVVSRELQTEMCLLDLAIRWMETPKGAISPE